MSFPPNEFPERAPGCCTEGGSMVPLPSGRLAASQHYAKETRTSSFIFVLSHEHTGGTKRKKKQNKSQFCAAQKKASSPSCEDKPFWWNERRDTQSSSRDEWPLCSPFCRTIIRLPVLHQCPKRCLFVFIASAQWFVVYVGDKSIHLAQHSALSGLFLLGYQ